MYLTSILEVQYCQIHLHNAANENCHLQSNEYNHQSLMYSMICEYHKSAQ